MMKELRRLLLCAIGFAVCSLVLWRCYPKLASCKLLLFLGIVAILAFAALRSAVQARAAISHLTDNDIICQIRNIRHLTPFIKSGRVRYICCKALSSAGIGGVCFLSLSTKLNGWNAVLTVSVCRKSPLQSLSWTPTSLLRLAFPRITPKTVRQSLHGLQSGWGATRLCRENNFAL